MAFCIKLKALLANGTISLQNCYNVAKTYFRLINENFANRF